MPEEWYYTIQGQQMGPVSTTELQQLAAQRRLQPSDLVWKEGMAKWVPAANTQGLFPALPSAPVPSAAVPAAAAVPDDYDDRPRRRRREPDDLDDFDDRPRRRRARSGGGMSTGVILLIVGGVVLLMLGGVAVVVLIVLVGGVSSGPGNYTVNLGPGESNSRYVHFNQSQ